LNLNILASRQNIKNLDSNFWAIYVGNIHANFQVSSSTSVGREWGDIRKEGSHTIFGPIPIQKFLLPLASLGRNKWKRGLTKLGFVKQTLSIQYFFKVKEFERRSWLGNIKEEVYLQTSSFHIYYKFWL